jgi:hypothetical protein
LVERLQIVARRFGGYPNPGLLRNSLDILRIILA